MVDALIVYNLNTLAGCYIIMVSGNTNVGTMNETGYVANTCANFTKACNANHRFPLSFSRNWLPKINVPSLILIYPMKTFTLIMI